MQIQKGNGKVCDYKYRQIARKDTRATAKVGGKSEFSERERARASERERGRKGGEERER